MEVESQADRLLEERMEKLKQERDQLKKELKEKRRTEQEKAEKVKDKAKWLLEMQNDFDLAKASGKDVVSHFSDCYPDFKLLMNAIDEMEKTKFEMLPDSFRYAHLILSQKNTNFIIFHIRLMDQKLMISRRASVTPAEQIEKRTTTPAKGRKLSQTVSVNLHHRYKPCRTLSDSGSTSFFISESVGSNSEGKRGKEDQGVVKHESCKCQVLSLEWPTLHLLSRLVSCLFKFILSR